MKLVDVSQVTQTSGKTSSPDGAPRRGVMAWVVVFATALAAVWLVVVFGAQIGEWWERTSATLTSAEDFRVWVESLGAFGPVAYVLAQTLQVIFAPIPGSLFPPVGALAFGPLPGMLLSLTGLALGSAIVFLLARRFGRPLAVRLLGADRIQRYQHVVMARGNLLLWLVFLLPLLPDDAVCALAGVSGIAFRRFMVIATVGRIPAVAAGVFAMAGLEGAPAWVWGVATAGGVLLLWVGLRYRERLEGLLFRITRREVPGERGLESPNHPLRAIGDAEGRVMVAAEPEVPDERRDSLVSVLAVVLLTTSVTALVAIASGVSGLGSGLVLIWGAALAVLVAWGRDDD